MHLPLYLSYKLGRLIYPFLLLGRQKAGKHVYKIDGRKISLRENTIDAFILWETFITGIYKGEKFKIKPNDIIADIGGHIGIFAVYAASQAFSGRVFTYEPVPENFRLLKKNKEINRLTNLKIFNKAVTSDGRSIKLYISPSNSGGHSIHPVDSRNNITVPSVTLEEIFIQNKLRRINYLKIDTEGSEFDIILNTPKKVFRKVDKIVMEYHDFAVSGQSHIDLVKYLEDCGFIVYLKSPLLIRKIFKMGMILAKRRD